MRRYFVTLYGTIFFRTPKLSDSVDTSFSKCHLNVKNVFKKVSFTLPELQTQGRYTPLTTSRRPWPQAPHKQWRAEGVRTVRRPRASTPVGIQGASFRKNVDK